MRSTGETLLRTLMAWARGERRVCSMVRAPSPQEEDRRRLTRERGTLLKERIQYTNRVKGLLSGQGVRDYNPLRRDRFERLEALRTGDGRELPPMLNGGNPPGTRSDRAGNDATGCGRTRP
jgi:transposase